MKNRGVHSKAGKPRARQAKGVRRQVKPFNEKLKSTKLHNRMRILKIMLCVRLKYIRRRMRRKLIHFNFMVSLGGMRKFND